MKRKVFQLAFIGVATAIICVLSPLSIPIGVVPVAFANLAIYMILYVLGMKKGTVSVLIYLLIGLIGVPVFSNFTGGPGKLLGPTGGYLIGYIFMALLSGYIIDRDYERRWMCFSGMVLGMVVLYAFGTAWLSYQADLSFRAALTAGVLPFVPFDLVKISVAALIGSQIRKRFIQAGLF